MQILQSLETMQHEKHESEIDLEKQGMHEARMLIFRSLAVL
jgi:hypothetical protein